MPSGLLRCGGINFLYPTEKKNDITTMKMALQVLFLLLLSPTEHYLER